MKTEDIKHIQSLQGDYANMQIEDTPGYKVAICFKPFINPKCTEHMEIVKDMAKSINGAIKSINGGNESVLRSCIRQLLSSLDYDKLTDYQAKCVLLIEKDLTP